jgi:hypothetical protein
VLDCVFCALNGKAMLFVDLLRAGRGQLGITLHRSAFVFYLHAHACSAIDF